MRHLCLNLSHRTSPSLHVNAIPPVTGGRGQQRKNRKFVNEHAELVSIYLVLTLAPSSHDLSWARESFLGIAFPHMSLSTPRSDEQVPQPHGGSLATYFFFKCNFASQIIFAGDPSYASWMMFPRREQNCVF